MGRKRSPLYKHVLIQQLCCKEHVSHDSGTSDSGKDTIRTYNPPPPNNGHFSMHQYSANTFLTTKGTK